MKDWESEIKLSLCEDFIIQPQNQYKANQRPQSFQPDSKTMKQNINIKINCVLCLHNI